MLTLHKGHGAAANSGGDRGYSLCCRGWCPVRGCSACDPAEDRRTVWRWGAGWARAWNWGTTTDGPVAL